MPYYSKHYQKRLGMAISQTALLSANIPGSYSNYDSMEISDGSNSANPHQQHLLQQLLNMTEEDLNKLPPEGRQRMIALREQILNQGI